MVAAIIFAIVVVIVIPVGFLMSTSIAAAAFGGLLKNDAERRNADSELVETNF